LQHDLLPEELKSAWVASTSGEVVVSGVASQKIRVLNALILAESGGTVQFQSGSAGELLTPPFAIAPSGTLSLGNTLGVFETAVGEGLQTVVSSGIEYQTLITYREVAA
jgi:hypothetical protein